MLDRGYLKKATGWMSGDFDYSGFVTASDYLVIDTSSVAQAKVGTLSPEFLAMREAQFGPEYVSSLIAAVPEPSLLLPLAACLPVLSRRRRRAVR
jgi:hypothetical protein